MKAKRAKRKDTATVASARSAWWMHAVAIAGLLAASVALYWPATRLGFFSLDDPDYVINNPFLEPLTWANVVRLCTAPYFANFSPLHPLSYAVDVAVAGSKQPFALHLSSVLWNAFAVAMVYGLAFSLRAHAVTAAAAALLFLAHPAHVEVAAWISSRKDLVATAFGVLAMTLYVLYRRRGRLAWGYYAGSVASFLLATAGKQSVVLLPAVMLTFDWLVEKRRHWAMLADKIPFGLITILFALPTLGAQPDTLRTYSLPVLAANQIWNLWLLTGFGTHVVYRAAFETAGLPWMGHMIVIGLAAAAWIVPALLHRTLDPVRLVLWYWILVQLIPPAALSFISPVTDRYLFLPSVGLCILLADAILRPSLRNRLNRPGAVAAVLVLAALWAWRTHAYLGEWNDPRSVWYAATTKSRAFQNNEYLGTVYQEAGDRLHQLVTTGKALDPARELPLARAVLNDAAQVARLNTEWNQALPTPAHSGARSQTWPESTAYRDRLWDLAWEQFELAVARRGTINTPNLFMRRGMILNNRGKSQDAIAQFHIALRFAQTHTYEKVRQENVTHITRALGIAHWKLRQYAQARDWFLEARKIQRASGQVWVPTLDQEVAQITRLADRQPPPAAPNP
ncbi:MAG: hypothetical protein JXQ71_17770 [Verrucomicrobia bacterium]|nr:hypothetical protein [Verrucomicrobiota bacterium]